MIKYFICICFLFITSLHAEVKVLALSGSTREKSYNKELVQEAAGYMKAQGAQVTVIDLKKLPMPFYDADLEEKDGQPKNGKAFRKLLIDSDIVIIASPEYNGSVSGVLKNAIDWASREDAANPTPSPFKGKKFILMSTSPGKSGGANGLEHLRAILTRLGGNVLSEQITVPNAPEQFSQKDAPYHQKMQKVLSQAINS